jgi:hypothetical protein
VHVEADFVDGNGKNFAVVIATDEHLQPIGSVAGSSWYKPCFPDEGEVSVKVFDAPVFYRERISPTAVKQAKLCPSVFELLDLLVSVRRVAQSRADESQPNACPLLSDLKGLQERWITWTEDGGQPKLKALDENFSNPLWRVEVPNPSVAPQTRVRKAQKTVRADDDSRKRYASD